MLSALSSLLNCPTPSSLKLGNIEARLKPQMPHDTVRWVKADSIHLTLKFLGQVPSDQLGLITSSLRAAVAVACAIHAGSQQKRVVSPTSIGRASYGWVFKEDNHRLHALQRAVENAIAPLGYPTEIRDFTPHLTLGRLARDVRPDRSERASAKWCRRPASVRWASGRSSRWRSSRAI